MTSNTMPPNASLVSARWLVSPAYDLSFFVAAGIFTFVFWGFYALLNRWGYNPTGSSILITYFFFTALFDLPHIFQTFSRTHADPEEFQRRPKLYTWGLPCILCLGFLFPLLHIEPYIFLLAALYGSYHIVRQHVGFVRMYQHLNQTESPGDRQFDIWTVHIFLLSCVFSDYVDVSDEPFSHYTVYGDHYMIYPVMPEWLGELVMVLGWFVLLAWILRQLMLLQQRQPLNLPKLCLIAMACSTHFAIFTLAAVPFLVAEAIETAYHTIQYHGFMGHYQRASFPQVKQVALKWLLASLGFGLVAGAVEIWGYQNPVFYIVFTPISMLVLFHYYIDGKIWKFSSAPELKKMLTNAPPTSSHQSPSTLS